LIAGTVYTASQSNITAVGTLASLSVSGNANVGNIGATNIVGTLTTASQTNITSIGTLGSLSVTANANIGNIGTGGLITATGNIQGGNLVTGGMLSVTGNANVGNIGAASGIYTTLSASGNVTAGNVSVGSGTVTVGTVTTGANTTAGTMTGNFTFNYTGVPTTTARTITLTLILGQGGTAYVPTTLQVNSAGVTINWAGGITPSGRASKIDVASFFIYNVSGTFTAVGALSSYG
jgi:filamentous hemagglutinin